MSAVLTRTSDTEDWDSADFPAPSLPSLPAADTDELALATALEAAVARKEFTDGEADLIYADAVEAGDRVRRAWAERRWN